VNKGQKVGWHPRLSHEAAVECVHDEAGARVQVCRVLVCQVA
jgi:hypothetical protein